MLQGGRVGGVLSVVKVFTWSVFFFLFLFSAKFIPESGGGGMERKSSNVILIPVSIMSLYFTKWKMNNSL